MSVAVAVANQSTRRLKPLELGRLLQYGLALTSAGGALVHISSAGDHSSQPFEAALFMGAAVAQLVWAGLIMWRTPRWLLAAGALFSATLIACWALSRTTGLGFLGGDVETIGFKDGIAVLFEVAVIVGAALFALLPAAGRAVLVPAGRLAFDGTLLTVAGLTLTAMVFAPGHAGGGHGGEVASGHHGEGEGEEAAAGHTEGDTHSAGGAHAAATGAAHGATGTDDHGDAAAHGGDPAAAGMDHSVHGGSSGTQLASAAGAADRHGTTAGGHSGQAASGGSAEGVDHSAHAASPGGAQEADHSAHGTPAGGTSKEPDHSAHGAPPAESPPEETNESAHGDHGSTEPGDGGSDDERKDEPREGILGSLIGFLEPRAGLLSADEAPLLPPSRANESDGAGSSTAQPALIARLALLLSRRQMGLG